VARRRDATRACAARALAGGARRAVRLASHAQKAGIGCEQGFFADVLHAAASHRRGAAHATRLQRARVRVEAEEGGGHGEREGR
jgi:hypothetical protein